MSKDWDPQRYGAFRDLRLRKALDLLAQVPGPHSEAVAAETKRWATSAWCVRSAGGGASSTRIPEA